MKKISILLIIFICVIETKGEDRYMFLDDSFSPIPVFYVSPKNINKDTRLVVVMHGRKRNGKQYRDQWIEKAKELNLLVIVPQFSEQDFPGVYQFNYGNVHTENNQLLPPAKHLFSIIDPLVKFSLKKFKITSNNWGIYGHGAGAHFVHRYVLYQPEANHTLAIAANLGWYLSMTDQEWPFGLTNSGIDAAQLKQAFGKYFLLMLGKADISTKPNTGYVKEHWDTINLQGEHRLARGRNFFKSSVEKSKEVDQFFKWGMVEVPTTKGHGNTKQMVPYAAEMFFARLR
jgi:poly(3-hydroxybutyrate) depolymerase